jgi:hypothetical protein
MNKEVYFFFFFAVLGMDPRATLMLGKRSTTDTHLQPSSWVPLFAKDLPEIKEEFD